MSLPGDRVACRRWGGSEGQTGARTRRWWWSDGVVARRARRREKSSRRCSSSRTSRCRRSSCSPFLFVAKWQGCKQTIQFVFQIDLHMRYSLTFWTDLSSQNDSTPQRARRAYQPRISQNNHQLRGGRRTPESQPTPPRERSHRPMHATHDGYSVFPPNHVGRGSDGLGEHSRVRLLLCIYRVVCSSWVNRWPCSRQCR